MAKHRLWNSWAAAEKRFEIACELDYLSFSCLFYIELQDFTDIQNARTLTLYL